MLPFPVPDDPDVMCSQSWLDADVQVREGMAEITLTELLELEAGASAAPGLIVKLPGEMPP